MLRTLKTLKPGQKGTKELLARRLIREWAAQYQDELKKMWDTQEFVQLPGLE